MTKILLKLIEIYQKTFSPDHGIFSFSPNYGCRFYPSCSEFYRGALEKHGIMKGTLIFLYRILRCNPLSRGGVDMV